MKVVSKFSWIPMIPDSESSDTFWARNLVCKMHGGAGRRRQSHHSLEFGGSTFLFNLRESQRHWIVQKNQQKNWSNQRSSVMITQPTANIWPALEKAPDNQFRKNLTFIQRWLELIAPQRSPDIEKHPYSMKLFNKNTSTKKWRHSMFD